MIEPATNAGINITGSAITAAISFLFGVPVAVLIAAFAGAWMGIAVGEKKTFTHSMIMIAVGTVASGYLTPAALYFVGEMPQRPAAAILGFFVVHTESRKWLMERVKSWFSK